MSNHDLDRTRRAVGAGAIVGLFDDARPLSSDGELARKLVLWCLLLIGIAIRLPVLSLDVTGDHDFRQSVVMAQALSFTSDSILAPLETFDTGRLMFDVPFFQVMVGWLSELPGLEPIVSARLIGLVIFAATFFAIQLLLSTCGFPARLILLSQAIFVTSPLSTHYSVAPIPDNLAIAFGLFSIGLLYRHRASGRGGDLLAGVALGVLSTLIKSPVYAFFIGGFMLHWLLFAEERLRSLRLHVLLGLCFASVAIGAELLRSVVMQQVAQNGFAQDPVWYFGTFADRLNPYYWWRIEKRWLLEYGNPITAILSMIGLFDVLRRRSAQGRFVLAYLLSAFLLVLVFFNVHRHHSYYQLSFLLVFCLTGAMGIEVLAGMFTSKDGDGSRQAVMPSRGFLRCIVAFFALSTLFALFHPIRGLRIERPDYAALITSRVPREGFVYFADYDNSPAPLYVIRRRGVKVVASEGLCAVLESQERPGAYLFVTPDVDVAAACPAVVRGSAKELIGWSRELDVGGIGTLYRSRADVR